MEITYRDLFGEAAVIFVRFRMDGKKAQSSGFIW
jgi:hypothetical protein